MEETRSLAIRTLNSAVGVLPWVGYFNIKLTRNGGGTTLIRIGPRVSGAVVKISGGKFVVNGADQDTYTFTSTTNVPLLVRIDSEVGYIHIKKTAGVNPADIILFNEVVTGLSATSPIVDYNSREFLFLTKTDTMFKDWSGWNRSMEYFSMDNVASCTEMFFNTDFNQPITYWNTSKMTGAYRFLAGCPFNQPVANLDFSNSLDNRQVFGYNFNQDVSALNYNKEADFTLFIVSNAFSPQNYDKLLIALAAKDWTGRVRAKVFSVLGTIKYTSAGATARASLVSSGWTVTDGGMVA